MTLGEVRLRRLEWRTYRVPYTEAFVTAHGTEYTREGLIVRLFADDGLVGIGEAAPVPAFGGGTLADAALVLGRLAPRLIGLTLDEVASRALALDPETPGCAAVACGLDTALLDQEGQRTGVTVAALLRENPRASVPVNATVGAADPAVATTIAARAVTDGFRCVKLKVGVAGSDGAELDRLARVREAIGPTVALRLDANGAWTVDQAIELIRAATRFDLELVEQPVPAADLNGLRRVRAAVDVPIGADEAACTPGQARRVLAADAADVLVVKPMLTGGPRRAREIIALAEAFGRQAVVTSTVDSAVGVAMSLHLAATLGSSPLACGLATGSLLVADLCLYPLRPRDGQVVVPDGAGLGVELDERQIERFADPWREAEG